MNSLPKLPITYLMYLTTEGYGGCSTLYRSTLDHTERHLPLSSFRHLVASIKITPGREAVAEVMKEHLVSRGFIVETATAPWQRGPKHFEEYLKDMRRMSQHEAVRDSPYIFTTDHDYPLEVYKDPLIRVIHRMTQLLDDSFDTMSVRFQRQEDVDAMNTAIASEPERDLWWSKDWNLQPLVMRSIDYYRACKVIEDNWAAATSMHGEALWREVLAPMSRSPRKHAVWLPGYAQCVNLGVPHYADVAKRLNLTIYPNPTV